MSDMRDDDGTLSFKCIFNEHIHTLPMLYLSRHFFPWKIKTENYSFLLHSPFVLNVVLPHQNGRITKRWLKKTITCAPKMLIFMKPCSIVHGIFDIDNVCPWEVNYGFLKAHIHVDVVYMRAPKKVERVVLYKLDS